MNTDLAVLSAPERKVLVALLDDEATITAVVPDNSEPKELLSNLSICCAVLGRLEDASAKLKPLIGRFLAIIKSKPQIYKDLGYKSFSEFEKAEVYAKLRISRSSAWEAKRIAEAFPDLHMSEYEKIGTTKLVIASKITNSEQCGCDKVLLKAKELPLDEFREWTVQQANGEDESKSSILITGGKRDIKMIKEFIADEELQTYLEIEGSARMVATAITEAETTWKAEIADQKRA